MLLRSLYLADEMYNQKNQTIDVIFGEPIQPNHFTKNINLAEWAQKLKEHVYNLEKDNFAKF